MLVHFGVCEYVGSGDMDLDGGDIPVTDEGEAGCARDGVELAVEVR